MMALEQPCDQRGAEAHQRDRNHEAEYQDPGVFARRTGYGEHVVERHRNVGDDDLRHRLPVGLGWSAGGRVRSEEHTSELQSLMRISYAVFCLQKKNNITENKQTHRTHTS